MNPKPRRERRDLTRQELTALLNWFDADQARAAERYQIVREKVIWVLDHRGCEPSASADLADVVLTVAARRLARGGSIETESFFLGVARKVLSEHRRRLRTAAAGAGQQTGAAGGERNDPLASLVRSEDLSRRHEILSRLTAEDRELLLAYSADPERRPMLAAKRKQSIAALYTQVCRLRRKLNELLRKPPDGRAR